MRICVFCEFISGSLRFETSNKCDLCLFLLRKVHYHPISRRSSTTGHNASPVDLQLSWLEAVCIHCEPVAIRHLVGGRPKLQKKKISLYLYLHLTSVSPNKSTGRPTPMLHVGKVPLIL